MLKFMLRKFLCAVLLLFTVMSVFGCFAEDEEKLDYTELVVGTPLTDSIDAFGTKVYRVNFTSTGIYSISLADLESNCGITICSYDSNDTSLDDLSDNILGEIDAYLDNTSETGTIVVSATGYYYVVVDEWDVIANTYTLSITKVTKSGEKTVNVKLEPVEINSITDASEKDMVQKWSTK